MIQFWRLPYSLLQEYGPQMAGFSPPWNFPPKWSRLTTTCNYVVESESGTRMLANMLADESQACSELASGQLGWDSDNSASPLTARLNIRSLSTPSDFSMCVEYMFSRVTLNSYTCTCYNATTHPPIRTTQAYNTPFTLHRRFRHFLHSESDRLQR